MDSISEATGRPPGTVWVEVVRGGMVESVHRVHVAVSDGDGVLRAQAGNVGLRVLVRSAVKPIQAIPLVEDGLVERWSLTGPELAVCCASHSGEPYHVAAAAGLLARIGLDESALACGAHAPFHGPSADALREAGREPGRLHNNCSGKHAGMLLLAHASGWPTAGYQRAGHPVQERMLAEIARWAELPEDEIATAVDGCGVVTFALPLEALAGAFGRLARSARGGGTPAGRIVRAMVSHPEYVGGTDRLCTELMRATAGRVFAKVGAEGVYAAGVPGAELGIALKVEDGARRAADPALLAVLGTLGLLPDPVQAKLESFARPDVRNTRGEVVGVIRARSELSAC